MKKVTKKTKSQDVALITGNPNDKVVISPEDAPRKYQTEAIKLLKAKLKKPEYTYAGPTEKLSVDTAPDKKVNAIKKLVSKMTTQPVTEEDLNKVFSSLSEAGALRKLGSIATSPVRAAGLLGKTARVIGTVAKNISEPDKALSGVGTIANKVVDKISKVGSLNKDPEKDLSNTSDTAQKIMQQRLKQSLEVTKQQQIATKQKKLQLQKQSSSVAEGKGLWDNIHAKRNRIKAGSGEKMRKPGSEGAPSKQDFVDASEAMEKKTPQEKFKAGLKKAGYDPDAGAKRLTDLLAKQKKEREEHEKKYAHLYEDQIDESFVVSRAAGYSGVYTAADLGMKIQGGFAFHPSVMEEGGAGDEGTDTLTNKYKKDTPGEQLDAAVRMMKAKRKANSIC